MGRTVDWGETIVIDGAPPAASNAVAETANIEIARATHLRMHFLRGLRWSSNMSVSQMALESKTSFRSNLFRRHDVSSFATRKTSRKIDVFDTNFAERAGMQRKIIDPTCLLTSCRSAYWRGTVSCASPKGIARTFGTGTRSWAKAIVAGPQLPRQL